MSLNQSFISDFSEYYRRPQRTKIKYKLFGSKLFLEVFLFARGRDEKLKKKCK